MVNRLENAAAELDSLGEAVEADEDGEAKRPPLYYYELYGVIVHSGGLGGGHYIAYTKRSNVYSKSSLVPP